MNRLPLASSAPSRPIPNAGVRASRANPGETVFAISDRSIAVSRRSMPSGLAPASGSPARSPSWPIRSLPVQPW